MTAITYVARVSCARCPATVELPALAYIEGGCSDLGGGRCVAELDCDTYSAGWHNCGDYVLCGPCWRGETAAPQ